MKIVVFSVLLLPDLMLLFIAEAFECRIRSGLAAYERTASVKIE